MADDDWKTRVGIEINFNSDDEENIGVPLRYPMENTRSPLAVDSPDSSFEGRRFFNDDILSEYADYGSTPPRTRISRRQRERKAKSDQLSGSGVTKAATRVIHPKATRRNTLDSIYFAELIEKSDLSSPQHEIERPVLAGRYGNKRSMKLLRGSERDLKLDMPRAVVGGTEADDRAESLPLMAPQPGIKVETCNRFMSLTSKLVACRAFKRSDRETTCDSEPAADRVDFYHTFALLIRMGSGERQVDKNNPKRTLSREEHLWQNELKDLIWLELQAWHAGRTPTEQDAFLCRAREGVEPLLNEIMAYRFSRKPRAVSTGSTHSQDSGLGGDVSRGNSATTDTLCCAATLAVCPHRARKAACEACIALGSTCEGCTSRRTHITEVCDGCRSMFCHGCNDAQESALREIEALLDRLEAVEALYPSSKVFAVQHPLYKCGEFVSRVKAMCLWLNYTKHHRLQLKILGKLLMLSAMSLDTRRVWPKLGNDEDSSGAGTDLSDSYSRSSSLEERVRRPDPLRHVVQFDVDGAGGSPSDSNNSTASHGTSSSRDSDFQGHGQDVGKREPSTHANTSDKNPYRKYIEEVLKTKGLRKALAFLESLHTRVLLKSMISLEKCPSHDLDDVSQEWPSSESVPLAEALETRRYGFWSAETQALNVPSYRSAFLFLARIPLDVVHEFLVMRLEQKPEHPSVLSIRQLMRELKEGLAIAALHRSRFLRLMRAVAWDPEEATDERLDSEVRAFDDSVAAILRVYLDYLKQWIDMVQQERFQKHLLEEEWLYVKNTCLGINNGGTLAATSFCHMAGGMLNAIGDFLSTSVDQLRSNLEVCDNCVTDDCSSKHCMLSVCRDLQSLCSVVRCRALKAVAFAKTLRKDLEDDPVHSCANADVADAVQQLKMEALLLCHSVAHSIREMEKVCDCFGAVDDCDKVALLGRTREILHQAYKFGFEYHKEVHRLATGECRQRVSRRLVKFASMWMSFVGERCERGRGLRPRWAAQGLDFLMTVCEPQHTQHLTDQEFEELKSSMDRCISHVIGQPPSADKPPSPLPPSPRHSIDCSRSPLPLRHKFRASRSGGSLGHRRTPSGGGSLDETTPNGHLAHTVFVPDIAKSREDRVLAAVTRLDAELDARLRGGELIGAVTDVEVRDKIHIKLRSVTFGWQRGIKIGQGSYGKVYTAVNNETGELMAVKEIALQPNDHRTIRRVAEELRIFEGIHHRHLVRYYGVEIHREEMLIFMEFCAEGTLEGLAGATEGGLPEALIRRYTRQLLQAVATLHGHGIVHRDVKSANIFLTDEGNCLKLGDFGSAVKIKAHTTVPGELQGFVGTQAYMAPEVFMKTTSEGHGRAVDIWSVGCVVVEMASGERPWAEFDSNYQIMFKVGMGETPAVPDSLSAEGAEFLALCLRHDPRDRATALSLLQHPFSKVDGDEENLSLPLPL